AAPLPRAAAAVLTLGSPLVWHKTRAAPARLSGMARIREGPRDAVTYLVVRHIPSERRDRLPVARRGARANGLPARLRAGNRTLAEDITSETFVRRTDREARTRRARAETR